MPDIYNDLMALRGNQQQKGGDILSDLQSMRQSSQTSQVESSAPTGSFGQTLPQISDSGMSFGKSPLSFVERLDLSFADDIGREKRLRQKFSIVKKLPNGKYAVGNSMNDIRPIDPQGLFNDTLGDLADVAAVIPTITGQVIGGAVGALTGNPLGVIGGAGLGAFAGEAISRGIGKISGVDLRKNQELVTDAVISGAFGAAGEGLGQAFKFAGKGLSKVATNSLDKAIKSHNNPSVALRALAKVFRVTAAVDEKAVVDAGMYGFNNTLTPKYANKGYVHTLTKKLVDGVTRRNKALGKMVGQGDDWAKANFGKSVLEIDQAGAKLLNTLSDTSIGLVDDMGTLNKAAFTESADYRTMKQLTDLFFAKSIKNKNILVPRNITVGQAIDFKKRTGTALKNYFKSGRVNPKAERAIAQYMDDVSNSIAKKVTSTGIKPEVNPFIKANKNFRQWKGDLKLLKQNGLDLEDITDLKKYTRVVDGEKRILHKGIESFAENLEKKTTSTQEAFNLIANQIGVKFPGGGLNGTLGTLNDELVKWNAAQGFVGANPSLLRLGAIAGMTGISLGSGEPDSAIKRLGLGVLLGTPAGAKILLKAGAKTKGALGAKSMQKILSNKQLDSKLLRALISQSTMTKQSRSRVKKYIDNKKNK